MVDCVVGDTVGLPGLRTELLGDPDLRQNRIAVPARSTAPLRQAVSRLRVPIDQPAELVSSTLSIQRR